VLKATEEIADTPTSRSRDYKTTAICDTASAQAKTRSRFPCASHTARCHSDRRARSNQITSISVNAISRKHARELPGRICLIWFEVEVNKICSVLNSLTRC
jgi:hypothetical protein